MTSLTWQKLELDHAFVAQASLSLMEKVSLLSLLSRIPEVDTLVCDSMNSRTNGFRYTTPLMTLKTLTSLNKESRPFFLADNRISIP